VRYVVLGCGAVGGTVAAGLARDGHEVLACDADPAVVSAVAARGLRIEGPVENFTVAVPAVTPGDLPARIDGPVLVAVKAHHTAAAAALLAGRLHGDAFTVALQNGLTGGILAGAVGPGRVVEAVVNFGADMLAPGVVLQKAPGHSPGSQLVYVELASGQRFLFVEIFVAGRDCARSQSVDCDVSGTRYVADANRSQQFNESIYLLFVA